jgi:hypothetical protein
LRKVGLWVCGRGEGQPWQTKWLLLPSPPTKQSLTLPHNTQHSTLHTTFTVAVCLLGIALSYIDHPF